jgi:hypothetical protein
MPKKNKKTSSCSSCEDLMLDIIGTLQQKVDIIAKEKFGYDIEHPPVFYVSILYAEKDMHHQIVLTVIHGGACFSRVIFPKNKTFDYIPLEEEMGYSFNATI